MRIAITGPTGFIGSALSAHLTARGHDVVPVVRTAPTSGQIGWDPAAGRLDPADLAGVDAVVHLAGAGIGDRRWTPAYKRVLMDSRVDSTSLLARTMADLGSEGPRILISGSAVGFYGDRGDEVVDERSEGGPGFLADICRAWEAAAAPAAEAGLRVAMIRTGIVLGRTGGSLKKLLPLFKIGAGGRFGNGRQWWSWITMTDEVRAIEFLIDHEVSGPVNLTAPNPARNAEFAKTLGSVLHRPALVPVPAFGPKLLLGSELADALLFTGQRVLPTVLEQHGFAFEHADLATGLQAEIAH